MSPRIYQDNEVESTMKAGELFRRFITDQKVIINLEQINEVTLERFKNLTVLWVLQYNRTGSIDALRSADLYPALYAVKNHTRSGRA